MDEQLFGRDKKKNYITGQFISSGRGFGFVEVEGRDEDIFIQEYPR